MAVGAAMGIANVASTLRWYQFGFIETHPTIFRVMV